MGTRRSRHDKNEGKMDRAKGRMKESGCPDGRQEQEEEGRPTRGRARPRRRRAPSKTSESA